MGTGVGSTAHRRRGRGRLHLLVWLHFPADHPEGFGRGIVIDLDSAEGLGACASRHPPLVAVIVKHHGGPAGADNCFAARKERERDRSRLAEGRMAPSFQGWSHSPSRSPWKIQRQCERMRETCHKATGDRPLRRSTDWEGKTDRWDRARQTDWETKRQTGDVRKMRKERGRKRQGEKSDRWVEKGQTCRLMWREK